MSEVIETPLKDFLDSLEFLPDKFQVDALRSVESGHSVVVTAPTGAGKTVVGEGAIAITVAAGKRAFYTTPIKALSNQKYNDLVDSWGIDKVGLLTGDNVINGDAPIVVMTTEVLRNMIYEGSQALLRLGVVILDEVHYLADRSRGSVWEEIIIHLEPSVPIVSLSATIANPEEFTDWIRSRRGPTDLIVETSRPVPLTSMYMWKDRHQGGSTDMAPIFGRGGRPNPMVTKILSRSRGRIPRFATPRRTEVVEFLYHEGLLPSIYFVFSRKGCDAFAGQIASSDLGLTSKDERRAIRAIIDEHVAHLNPDDLTVLGFERWQSILERGAAAHHAGLIPAFKETVEQLFLAGLVKVVAATETLALGINMPARTVVIESLSKFNGETHELLLPSDYTQLTGRAGRRGIDTEGTAVVLHSSYVPFTRVSGIAAAGANPLRSSFAPTYNMTVNLMARYDSELAHELLSASFANFSDTYRRQSLTQSLETRESDLATFREAAECDVGDIWEYARESGTTRSRNVVSGSLYPGAVVDVTGTRYVVLARSWGGTTPRLEATDASGTKKILQTRNLPAGTVVVGQVSLPEPVRAGDRAYRNEVADKLETLITFDDPVPVFDGTDGSAVASCPDLDTHLGWVKRAERTERDIARLLRRIGRQGRDDISGEFDRLKVVLSRKGYTDGWRLTSTGETLRTLYNELDLLLADTLAAGVFDQLDPAQFGAIASLFTFETRGGDVPQIPSAAFASEPMETIADLSEDLTVLEKQAGVTPSREPDGGLVDVIYGWAAGLGLDEIFHDEDIRAGDFVRAARQLLDLLRQIRDGYPTHRAVASAAIQAIDRGIVSSEVTR
ncbi:MAG: DEAD/DEAH box helicase [Actinomycetota bacterium]